MVTLSKIIEGLEMVDDIVDCYYNPEKDEIFLKFLNEKETSIVSMDYGQQLKWILRSLAQEEACFSSAMYVLMLVSAVRETFLFFLL